MYYLSSKYQTLTRTLARLHTNWLCKYGHTQMADQESSYDPSPIERVWIGNDDVITEMPTIAFTHIVSIVSPVSSLSWPGIQYLRLDMKDGDEKLQHKLLRKWQHASDWIIDALKHPKTIVLIHCVYGKSRSASLVIYHMMRRTHMSFEFALKLLRVCRPCVNPHPIYARVLSQWGNTFGPRKDWFRPVHIAKVREHIKVLPNKLIDIVNEYCGPLFRTSVSSPLLRALVQSFETLQ